MMNYIRGLNSVLVVISKMAPLLSVTLDDIPTNKFIYKYRTNIHELETMGWDWAYDNGIVWGSEEMERFFDHKSSRCLYRLDTDSISFKFNEIDTHRLFIDEWIRGPITGKPITFNKFNNNYSISVYTLISSWYSSDPYSTWNDWIKYFSIMKETLLLEIGPEYENWHIFYINTLSYTGPMVAFANIELYTWFKLRIENNW